MSDTYVTIRLKTASRKIGANQIEKAIRAVMEHAFVSDIGDAEIFDGDRVTEWEIVDIGDTLAGPQGGHE